MDIPPVAGRRQWLGLAVLTLPTLLLALDLSVLYLALPSLAEDLDASSVQQLWITDVYGFMVAGFLVTMGTLGDRIGRRRLLLVGAGAFAAASVLAAFAGSAELLVLTRALLGVAGAAIGPSTLALVSTMFRDPGQRAVAISVWISCFVGGAAVGPVVGGVLLAHFWWGSVFLLGVPVMAVLLVAGPALLPEYRAERPGRLDPVSVLLSLGAILPVIYGLKETARHGIAFAPALAVLCGLIAGAFFLARQRVLDEPLLDLSLFRNRTFAAGLAMMLVGGIFLGGVTLLVTQFLQVVEKYSALRSGLLLSPAVLAMAAASMAAPVLARRFRPGSVMACGMAVAAVGYLVLTQVDAGSPAPLVVGWTIALGGSGLPAGLAVGLIIGSAPAAKAGSASSVSETCTELGLALGIAAIGSVATAVYRGRLDLPAGTPGPVVDAARDGITGALAADWPAVLASARSAYAAGLTVATGLSAVLSVGLAVFAAVMFRQVPAVAESRS